MAVDRKDLGENIGGVNEAGKEDKTENQHLPTAKSGSILRFCHRCDHHGYPLAESIEGGVVDNWGG